MKPLAELVREAHADGWKPGWCTSPLVPDCPVCALAAYAEAAEKRAVEAEREVGRIRQAFGHIHSHIGKEDGDDSCARCGLDLRDEIHHRVRAALRKED